MSGAQRAWLLYERGRNEEALEEARRALSEDPDDLQSHSVLALSLAQLGRTEEARRAADAAAERAPDEPSSHYVRAVVALRGGHRGDALQFVREAIRLEPDEPDYHAFEAQVHLKANRLPQALKSTERALELDPEHLDAKNLRSMTLAHLGRTEEAHEEIDDVLRLAPEDSIGHANRGWAYLHAREVPKAIEHFSESLRLDPSNGYARSGLVEALKARNPLYRAILTWYLFSARLTEGRQTTIVFGLLIGSRILSKALGRWSTGAGALVLVGYTAFVYFTWVGDILFNLMLWLDRKSRHVLDDEERVSAWLLGSCYVLAAVLFGLVALTRGPVSALFPLGTSIALGLPVAGVFSASKGWPRAVEAVVAGAIAFGIVAGALWAAFGPEEHLELAQRLQAACFFACVINTWIASALSRVGSKG